MIVGFFLYEGMTALDVVGPQEVLFHLPGVTIKRVAMKTGPIQTDSGLILTADYSLSELNEADVLLLPGSGKAKSLSRNSELMEWVKAVHETTLWTTSVCTGSLILGAAGLLAGKKSTTHWAAFDRLSCFGAIESNQRIVEDGKIITSAGVSAGIDMALLLASKISGKQVARAVQSGIEYNPKPPLNSGSPEMAETALIQTVRSKMITAFEDE